MRLALSFILKGCQYLLMLAVPLLWCACSEEEWLSPIEYNVLEEIKAKEVITLQETLDYLFEDYGVTPEMQADIEHRVEPLRLLTTDLVAYTITYNTTSPDGQPIVASGVVYYPKRGNPKGMLEVSPINKSKIDCASKSVRTAEIIPAFLGYICVIPDLIGCGVSEDLPISYMQHENAAVVSADLRKAAAELIRNTYGKALPNQSILFGYSLGGAISWSLARHYQLHPELGVKVTEVFTGGGAYNPLTAIEAFLATGSSQYAILPNIIYSMDYYDQLGLDFTKIFKGKLLEHYDEWCQGFIPIQELTKELGYDLDGYLELPFFSTENPEQQHLMDVAATKAIPNDWIPKAKVHLYSSKDDTYVPRQCSDQLYEYLVSVGADVEYTLMDEDHVMGGLVFGQAFLEHLTNKILPF
ncbi:MAG: alpha/beta fold hydrolase [Bacteroidaceae bacterium]|nr:alpha/beta fold hydrolase [Bacteroidaceae bacterium]